MGGKKANLRGWMIFRKVWVLELSFMATVGHEVNRYLARYNLFVMMIRFFKNLSIGYNI